MPISTLTGAAAAEVRLEKVTKRYGGQGGVGDLSLVLPRGAFVSLLGPSGCGKTTTLRLIAGFERPDAGDVFIRDVQVTAVPPYRRDFAMVFQNLALFPHLTVADNIAFGLKMTGVSRSEREGRVRDALALVRLDAFGSRFPKQLSGGQQQRVAIARALVIRPAVLLLDEPLGALDKNLRESMQVELRGLQRQLGLTTLFVTHDQEEALTMSDAVAVMRDGAIEQLGPPRTIYERPATAFVATFLGASNLFDATVLGREADRCLVDSALGRLAVRVDEARPGQRLSLSVRPERLAVGPADGSGVPARVREVIYRGATTQLQLAAGDLPFLALVQTASGPEGGWAPGSAVTLRVDPDAAIALGTGAAS